MNIDDLEKRLQRQPLRQIPAEWRGEILSACAPMQKAPIAGSIPLWRLLFARFPVAWGALAAVWIALIAINFLLFGSARVLSTHQRVAKADEPLSIRRLQSAELRQLAGGDQSISRKFPANLPATTPRSPRSERRRDEAFGEFLAEPPADFIA